MLCARATPKTFGSNFANQPPTSRPFGTTRTDNASRASTELCNVHFPFRRIELRPRTVALDQRIGNFVSPWHITLARKPYSLSSPQGAPQTFAQDAARVPPTISASAAGATAAAHSSQCWPKARRHRYVEGSDCGLIVMVVVLCRRVRPSGKTLIPALFLARDCC